VIDLALQAIVAQLNQALRTGFAIRDDVAVLGNVLEQDGSVGAQLDNRIVVSLVNIERETLAQRAPRHGAHPLARSVLTEEPVHLVLSVMFAANFSGSNYGEGLKMISAVVGFFQSRPVLDPHNTPGLDRRIDRLALDIANLSVAELSNLWSILSGKYLPSVLYRVRLVSVDRDQVKGTISPVALPRAEVAPQAQPEDTPAARRGLPARPALPSQVRG
jgi:hypothetical protein